MIYKAVVLSSLVLLQFSCSEYLKGKPKKQEAIEVSAESLSCLKAIAPKWKNFLETATTAKEIDDVFACVDSTLNEFQTRIQGGADAESFTNQELSKIFNTFLKDLDLSQSATNDLLVLKAAVLGGAIDKISKKEISDLRKFLVLLNAEGRALLPYIQLFKFKKEANPFSKKMLQDGFAQLNLSLRNLFKASQLQRSEYNLDDFQGILRNLKILAPAQQPLLALAMQVKTLLIGKQPVQSEADFLVLIDNLTEVLRLYSFQLQGFAKFEMASAEDLNQTIEYVEDWLRLLENSLQFKRGQTVAAETLDPIINEIAARGLIPIQVTPQTLISFYKLLITRAFDSGILGDPSGFSGLKAQHFSQITREIGILKIYLQFLSSLELKDRLPIATLQQRLKNFDATQIGWLQKFDESTRRTILSAFDELRGEFLSSRPVIYESQKMIIAADQGAFSQSWADLARAVYVKILSRELLIGWGNAFSTKLVANASISEAQLVQWYSDFKQFGIEVKTFDPRSVNSGSVSFKQANLLTYSADGDDKMNFFESVQYLNMLIAGGGQTVKEMYAGFEKANCLIAEKDVFEAAYVDEKCMIYNLRLNFKNYFANLPQLVRFAEGLSHEAFYQFYYDVMDVTRINPKLKGYQVETADLRQMSILLHSIESLYATADTNRNGSLSADEIRAAYPRFKAFAKKYANDNARDQIDKFNGLVAQTVGGYSCFSEDDLIRESFVFLVYNGRAPQRSDLNTLPCLPFRKRPLIDFPGEVNRARVINTFKILKTVLGS